MSVNIYRYPWIFLYIKGYLHISVDIYYKSVDI